MTWKGVVLWTIGVLVVATMVLLAPSAENPETTRAFRRLLSNVGFSVSASPVPPDNGTIVILDDRRQVGEARRLLRWVGREGGKLIVTDPESVFLDLLDAAPTGPIGLVGRKELEPGCLAPESAGVGHLIVRSSDVALRTNHEAFVSCFPGGEGAFVLIRSYGRGTVVLLGGTSPLTNEMLREAENAMFAVQLARGPQVQFAPPAVIAVGQPRGGIWDLLPGGGRVTVVGIVLAAVAFALVRARRLGRPTPEEALTPIPATELVRATARMFRRAKAAPYCGELLREAATARFARRLGSPAPDELSRILANQSGVSTDRVTEILRGPETLTDESLIHLGRELEELASRARRDGP